MLTASVETTSRIGTALTDRNPLVEAFFDREADKLAELSREMSERFREGGRLLAFGNGAYATDAQHVSVEFVHPVIVGKRALPALDLSASFAPSLKAILRPGDIVMGFGPPEGDPAVAASLAYAGDRGAMTIAVPGTMKPGSTDPFLHQEIVEILYHTLWETVHVFFEHRELGGDVGEASFLYPFLGSEKQDGTAILDQVARSIRGKAADDSRLRTIVAEEQADAISASVKAIAERLKRGGKLVLFGNGGSATDANDWALDCVLPPSGGTPIPAISLSNEPACLSALANDVGAENMFLRQLIAHARPEDVAIGISTSGGSRNIIAALVEARKRGLLTVALLGYDGGEIVRRGLADCAIVVRSDYIPRIQEVQASVYHTITELLARGPHA